MWRPRLQSVLAVVLFWQLGAGLLLAGPAFAAVPTAEAASAANAHCHTAHTTSSGTLAADDSGASQPAPHPGAPDCCQNLDACHCTCAQASFAVAPTVIPTPLAGASAARASDASPPPVQRTAEFFRPPI